MSLLTDEEIQEIDAQIDDGFFGQQNCIDFSRAIEAAVIKKLSNQEPLCWITPDGEGWRLRLYPPVNDTKLGWQPLFEHPKPPEAK